MEENEEEFLCNFLVGKVVLVMIQNSEVIKEKEHL